MTPIQIAKAQKSLGLDNADFAQVMEVDYSTLKKIKSPGGSSQSRRAPVRFVRLLNAYLAGFRPDDWPRGG